MTTRNGVAPSHTHKLCRGGLLAKSIAVLFFVVPVAWEV